MMFKVLSILWNGGPCYSFSAKESQGLVNSETKGKINKVKKK